MCTETIKNNKHHLQRKNRPLCIAVLSISRNLKLVYSVRNRTKSVQIWSYFWSVCSCIRTEYGPEITPYLNTFHAVYITETCSSYSNDWPPKFLSIKMKVKANLPRLVLVQLNNSDWKSSFNFFPSHYSTVYFKIPTVVLVNVCLGLSNTM